MFCFIIDIPKDSFLLSSDQGLKISTLPSHDWQFWLPIFICLDFSFSCTVFNKSKKTILLTFISIGLIYLFFQFPRNNDWFDSRILAYWSDFQAQKNHLGTEERKKRRWKSSYTISKEIAGFFEKQNKVKNTIVLIPPSGYFKERGIDYDVPEPAVFYYYTGLKTIWSNSHSVLNANWMVIANNRVYKIIPVIDKNCLADSVSAFKKYPLSL